MPGHTLSRRAFLGGLAAGSAGLAAGRLPAAHASWPLHPELAEDVKAEFLHTYRSYLRLAGDRDELHPVSGTGGDFFADGHPVALTRIESLGTLFVMELDDELDEAVEYVAEQVSFDIDAPFQMFEAIIRLEGGLLSGYHATGDRRLLAQAKDLADRLLPAFEESPTGIPWRFVNLRTGAVSGNRNVLAEIGTCITELGFLSRLTGDPRYFRAAKRAQRAVFERRSELGLVGTELDVETGEWTNRTATINPPVDSFFEYLWDGWDFLRDHDNLRWYRTLTAAIFRHLAVEIDGRLWFRSVDYETGEALSTFQSELSSFYAGLLAQSGFVRAGRRHHDAWKAALDSGFRILPEGLDPTTLTAVDKGNQLRPEYVDSALFLWFATGEATYVDRAVEYYLNMKATSRVPNGYTILTDVTTRPEQLGDLTSGYWYAENMKYYYLMFGRPRRFDYRHNYFTTEGNVLRGFRRHRG
jgi:mannosyl-oligosaccharide alpha-1,2-mannosidase